MSQEPVFNAAVWQPQEGRQEYCFTHKADIVGYGGAPGSGKTDGLLFHHLYAAEAETQRWFRGEITQSRGWAVYFRRLSGETMQSKQRFLQIVPLADRMMGMNGWNSSNGIYTYSCGFKYLFAGIEKPQDYLKFLSYEFVEIGFDELTEFEEEQFDWMCTRVRSPDPGLKQFFSRRWGSNPVGHGLEWVRNRWIAGKKSDVTYRKKVPISKGRVHYQTEVFIQAFLSDNRYLDEDGMYEAALRASQPHIADILLSGNWWAQKGAFLGAFWDADYHVCADHDIPRGSYRFRSCDFGIGSYSSITWWYVDNDGMMTAYHHVYLHDMDSSRQAEVIKDVEKYYGDWNIDDNCSMLNGPLDAQCFKRHGASGPSISDDFRRKGVAWRRSSKDRFNGLAEVSRRLGARMPLFEKDPQPTGALRKLSAKPMVRWMARCTRPISVIPIVPADPKKPGEVLRNYKHLHILDDLMFACMANKLSGVDNPDSDDWNEDAADELAEARRKRDWRKIASITAG